MCRKLEELERNIQVLRLHEISDPNAACRRDSPQLACWKSYYTLSHLTASTGSGFIHRYSFPVLSRSGVNVWSASRVVHRKMPC